MGKRRHLGPWRSWSQTLGRDGDLGRILRDASDPRFQGSRSSDLFAIMSPLFSPRRECGLSRQLNEFINC